MKITNEELLDEFRTPGRCEICRRWCRLREPHHVWAKGMGGGGRLDVRENLIALGSTLAWQCQCHSLIHANVISRETVLAVIAKRENKTVEEIQERIWELRRTPKG